MVYFDDLLMTRRSIRDFEDEDVPLELIKKIIKDSCLAPSSGNGQPWKFVIVKNREWIQRLSDESKRNFLSHLDENPNASIKRYEKTLKNERFNVFYNAPCLVFILAPRSIQSVHVDCALAACYFMFSAAEMGLGTCWVGLGANIRDREICRAIGIPEDCRIVAPIILGYPKNIPAPPPEMNPKSSRLFSDKSGKSAIVATLSGFSLTTPAWLTYKIFALAQGGSAFGPHKQRVLMEITGAQHLVSTEWVSKARLLSRVNGEK